MEKKRNSYLRGMTRVAHNSSDSDVKKILRNYKYKVPGSRATVHYETAGGKHTLYIPTIDAVHLGLLEK